MNNNFNVVHGTTFSCSCSQELKNYKLTSHWFIYTFDFELVKNTKNLFASTNEHAQTLVNNSKLHTHTCTPVGTPPDHCSILFDSLSFYHQRELCSAKTTQITQCLVA